MKQKSFFKFLKSRAFVFSFALIAIFATPMSVFAASANYNIPDSNTLEEVTITVTGDDKFNGTYEYDRTDTNSDSEVIRYRFELTSDSDKAVEVEPDSLSSGKLVDNDLFFDTTRDTPIANSSSFAPIHQQRAEDVQYNFIYTLADGARNTEDGVPLEELVLQRMDGDLGGNPIYDYCPGESDGFVFAGQCSTGDVAVYVPDRDSPGVGYEVIYGEYTEDLRIEIGNTQLLTAENIEETEESRDGVDVDVDVTEADPETEEDEPGCESGGPLAWILCPVARGMLGALDNLAGSELQQLLQVNAQVADSTELQEAVDGFRNIANGLLAIGFLFVIFGQALSLGIDAYTVKRMLPRVALAAIAIQLSTPVAVILIDIFNVLGIGIAELILSPIGESDWQLNFNPLSSNVDNYFTGGLSWLAEGAVVVAGVAAIGSALWALILALPTILIVVLITIAILVIRRLVLVALIILAPLAMAAWILPNTEKWAKEWFDTFIKVLLMFPLIMGVIAMGRFMASVSGITTSATPGSPTFIDSIVTLLALFGPYLLIPFTYQFAGKLFGSLGQMAGRLQGRALGGGSGSGGSGGGAGGLKGAWQNRANRYRAKTAAGQTKLSKSDGALSRKWRRGAAPGLNMPGSGLAKKLTENNADKIRDMAQGNIAKKALAGAATAYAGSATNKDFTGQKAATALAAEAAKELDEQNLTNDEWALSGLGFAADAEGDNLFEKHIEGAADHEQARARSVRQQWRQRLRQDPGITQAAQLAYASQGKANTKEKMTTMMKGFRGSEELRQGHFQAMVGQNLASGVHSASGFRLGEGVDGRPKVTLDEPSVAGYVAGRSGQQIAQTHKKDAEKTVAAMQTNLLAPTLADPNDPNVDVNELIGNSRNTVRQIASVLTDNNSAPAIRNAVQDLYSNFQGTQTGREIDQAMRQLEQGAN